MYRTGDRGRFLPDGQLEVAGRIAFFIKIRGYSVVPSAIEETLNRHPMVATAVVLALGDIGDHEKKLVAYIVGKSWEDIPSQKEMREHCKKNLPPYAVPSLFVPLRALPVSESSRKLDSKKLPSLESSNKIVEDKEREISELRAKQGISNDDAKLDFILEDSPHLNLVRDAWRKVLDLADDLQILSTDDFMDIGGHSLKLAQVRIVW
jgi:long-subunit acyl-CoA synthetase (AMP-forming)